VPKSVNSGRLIDVLLESQAIVASPAQRASATLNRGACQVSSVKDFERI
jgi:hypothetical protein